MKTISKQAKPTDGDARPGARSLRSPALSVARSDVHTKSHGLFSVGGKSKAAVQVNPVLKSQPHVPRQEPSVSAQGHATERLRVTTQTEFKRMPAD